MTQEDKNLLLKDLCGRLPYGVKVKTPYNDAILIGIIKRKSVKKDEYYIDAITDKQTYPVRYIQPYLRSMSSMTEEEKHEYYMTYTSIKGIDIPHPYKTQDWLNRNHFDYRGLIPMGLAIAVTKENNPYKE